MRCRARAGIGGGDGAPSRGRQTELSLTVIVCLLARRGQLGGLLPGKRAGGFLGLALVEDALCQKLKLAGVRAIVDPVV